MTLNEAKAMKKKKNFLRQGFSDKLDFQVTESAYITLLLLNSVEDKENNCVSKHAKSDNYVPPSIYNDIPSNPVSQCFIGFYGADGWNSRKQSITGIGLRATDAPFLYHLLQACGVKTPRIRFYKAKYISKTYGAAYNGAASWAMHDRALVDARGNLGLPSSRIRHTNIDKARAFLSQLDLLSLLRVILFWTAGDGSVIYDRRQGSEYRLDHVSLYAKDPEIFPLMKEALEAYPDMQGCCRVKIDQKGLYSLHLESHGRLDEHMLPALDSVLISIIHPKLKLLQRFLLQENGVLEYSYGSSRNSFYDYIGNNLDDKFLLVLGQDFHCLGLPAINAIFDFVLFPPVAQVQDFNLVEFRDACLRLQSSSSHKNNMQQTFIRYINRCTDRVVKEAQPINFNPEAKIQRQCQLCGDASPQTFPSRYRLGLHIYEEHGHNKIPCPYADCEKGYKTYKALRQHIGSKHKNR
ncbi:hypothetical protein MBANPS3_012124, partial [Mucor bainieri]